MQRHLCKFDFMPNYERWYEHGESQEQEAYNPVDSFEENEDRIDAMMDDFVEHVDNAVEVPEYFGLLALSKGPLHGTTTLSQLAAVTWLMAIKSKYNFSVSCYNNLVDLILDMLFKPHNMLNDVIEISSALSEARSSQSSPSSRGYERENRLQE
ncbi:hypothetical protein PAHAL_9G234600 [Panicum hallii]|uniref:Uncharacterized protein n=1 Tax=Panicum hallii TaxID=206008 RepID=A0A2T8I299_9POAL|nr:hypothetical protein PAHAL_9G234600 [Panicum hallii]